MIFHGMTLQHDCWQARLKCGELVIVQGFLAKQCSACQCSCGPGMAVLVRLHVASTLPEPLQKAAQKPHSLCVCLQAISQKLEQLNDEECWYQVDESKLYSVSALSRPTFTCIVYSNTVLGIELMTPPDLDPISCLLVAPSILT